MRLNKKIKGVFPKAKIKESFSKEKTRIKETFSKENIKGNLSTGFNVLSGKKGGLAALQGYVAVGCVGVAALAVVTTAGVALPLYVGIDLAVAALNANGARNQAKAHDWNKGFKG